MQKTLPEIRNSLPIDLAGADYVYESMSYRHVTFAAKCARAANSDMQTKELLSLSEIVFFFSPQTGRVPVGDL